MQEIRHFLDSSDDNRTHVANKIADMERAAKPVDEGKRRYSAALDELVKRPADPEARRVSRNRRKRAARKVRA